MENKNKISWKIFIVLLIIIFSVSTVHAITGKSITEVCGDYCFHSASSPTSSKCVGATHNSTIGSCTNIGCKTSCWGEYSQGDKNIYQAAVPIGGCTTNSPDVCVGSTGSTNDAITIKMCEPTPESCGTYCTHSLTQQGCSKATIQVSSCAEVGCSSTCWGFWSNGGDNNIYQNDQKYHEDCTNLNVDVCVGPNGRTDYSQSGEVYYDSKGNEILCPQTEMPKIVYTEVAPISIPLHMSFGILGTGTILPTAKPTCTEPIFLNGNTLIDLECAIAQKNYTTHNVTRYNYNWEFDYDVLVIASDPEKPVPMRVGQNMTAINPLGAGFIFTQFQGEKLWYIESFSLT